MFSHHLKCGMTDIQTKKQPCVKEPQEPVLLGTCCFWYRWGDKMQYMPSLSTSSMSLKQISKHCTVVYVNNRIFQLYKVITVAVILPLSQQLPDKWIKYHKICTHIWLASRAPCLMILHFGQQQYAFLSSAVMSEHSLSVTRVNSTGLWYK